MGNNISGKTAATGAAGAGSGVALAPLIIWVLGLFGVEMPPEVAAVAGGLLTTAVTTLIAWLVPAKSGKYVDTEPWVHDPAEDTTEPAADDTDWSNGPLGGMAAYASDRTPVIEGE